MPGSLLIGSVWPEPTASAAGTRTLQLLKWLGASLGPAWFATEAERRPESADLTGIAESLKLRLNDASSDRILEELRPDRVIFDRFTTEEKYGWRVEKTCPKALRILDTVDLHGLREARWRALQKNRSRRVEDWFNDIALRELSALFRCDLTLVVSHVEQQLLVQELQVPASLLHTFPLLATRSPAEVQSRPGFKDRQGFVWIGSFLHPPNRDGVQALKRDLWPRIRAVLPDADLHVYGADCPPAFQEMHDPRSGFLMQGRAADSMEALETHRVLLAPIRYGAGQKGKLLDAMQAGTPSVTTPVGAEGMERDGHWPGIIAESMEDAVAGAVELFSNERTWTTAVSEIPTLLEAEFSPSKHHPRLLQRLKVLQETYTGREPYRLMGALLRHHHHRSTEYMSRWIECKNRLAEREKASV